MKKDLSNIVVNTKRFFAKKPAAMATTALIIKPTIPLIIPNPVVSLSSSRTEKVPKEQSIMAQKRKMRKAEKLMRSYLISRPPKKQISIPRAIKITAPNEDLNN